MAERVKCRREHENRKIYHTRHGSSSRGVVCNGYRAQATDAREDGIGPVPGETSLLPTILVTARRLIHEGGGQVTQTPLPVRLLVNHFSPKRCYGLFVTSMCLGWPAAELICDVRRTRCSQYVWACGVRSAPVSRSPTISPRDIRRALIEVKYEPSL